MAQGAKLVNHSIASGEMFEGAAWKELIANCADNGTTLHFLGLFSDGNVHSHIDHLKAMLEKAKESGIKTVGIHTLLDGRDVPETSALDYVEPFEEFLAELNADGCDYRIASGGGRMVITMDRYGANWDMVRKGWETHVLGKGPYFKNSVEAIKSLREESGAIDQDLPAYVISDDGSTPIRPIKEGDSVIFFNFRGDRAIEITAAFEDENFDKFDRGPKLDVLYAGMMQYDGDLKVPAKYLVAPPAIDRTIGEYLCASGIKQLAISETQKYGHVTYFYNGNRSGMFDENLETYIEVPSDVVPFEERPWMKCAEITDKVIEAVQSGKYDFIRLNYPNGDMVGHTGIYDAVLVAMSGMDLQIKRVLEKAKQQNYSVIITSDHGNCEEMKDDSGNTLTNHTVGKVWCFIDAKGVDKIKDGGLNNIAPSVLKLMELEIPAEMDEALF